MKRIGPEKAESGKVYKFNSKNGVMAVYAEGKKGEKFWQSLGYMAHNAKEVDTIGFGYIKDFKNIEENVLAVTEFEPNAVKIII